MEDTEPLPDVDDDDPAWLDDATWDRLEFLIAAADAIGDRRLKAIAEHGTTGEVRESAQCAIESIA
jgi:hypothetical protein